MLPEKGCYQHPLFASRIRPTIVACGWNMMRVYHVSMHSLWGCRIVPDLGNKSSREQGLCLSRFVGFCWCWGFVRYLCCIRDEFWVELPQHWFACRLNLWVVMLCSTFSIAGRTFPLVPSTLIVTCASKLTPGDRNKALNTYVHYERV